MTELIKKEDIPLEGELLPPLIGDHKENYIRPEIWDLIMKRAAQSQQNSPNPPINLSLSGRLDASFNQIFMGFKND